MGSVFYRVLDISMRKQAAIFKQHHARAKIADRSSQAAYREKQPVSRQCAKTNYLLELQILEQYLAIKGEKGARHVELQRIETQTMREIRCVGWALHLI